MKKIILLLALFTNTFAYGESVRVGKDGRVYVKKLDGSEIVIQPLEKNNKDLIIQGQVTSKSNFGVGSIQQSILTETQFQAENGTEWVKVKGQAIAGSKLCTQYSICTLPSAEGRFLRDSVADAGLGTTQNQDTKLNDLTAYVSESEFDHGHSNGTLATNSTTDVASTAHSHSAGGLYAQLQMSGSYLGINTKDSVSYTADTRASSFSGVAESSARNQGTAVAGTTSNNTSSTSLDDIDIDGSVTAWDKTTNAPVIFSNTGTETRPDNLIVNTFIKIN